MSSAELPNIKGYVIKRKLAQGGMGVVYAAEDETLGRPVAIKMIRSELLNLEEGDTAEQREVAVARFLREARAAASIRSNHVAHVLQFGRTADGDLYLVLEYLDGLNLKQVVRKHGPLSVERVVAIGKQICRGMKAAHALGIVHRDLKPGNVMLIDQDGDADLVKILDFGVAKMVEDAQAEVTQTGSMVGTHTCMAPEQIRGQKVDARTDVYATGVLLFRLLTGRAPFTGSDPLVVLHQHLDDPAPKPSEFRSERDIPAALDAVITRCLEKDPEARISSMADLERLLTASLDSTAGLLAIDPRAPTEVFGATNNSAPTVVARQGPQASLSDAETRAMVVPTSGEFSVEVVDVGDAANPHTPGTNSTSQVVFISPPDTAPAAGTSARWAIVAAGVFGGVVIAVAAVSVLLYFAAANKAEAAAALDEQPDAVEPVNPETLEPVDEAKTTKDPEQVARAKGPPDKSGDEGDGPAAAKKPDQTTKTTKTTETTETTKAKPAGKGRVKDRKTERRADKKKADAKRKSARKASREKAAKAKKAQSKKAEGKKGRQDKKKADAPVEEKKTAGDEKKRKKPDFVRVRTGEKPE